jgi:hypothetical protein
MATKYTKWPQNIPNGHKIYQMATKYTKWPQHIPNGSKMLKMATGSPTFPVPRPSKMYPNRDFGMKIYRLATLFSKRRQPLTATRSEISACCENFKFSVGFRNFGCSGYFGLRPGLPDFQTKNTNFGIFGVPWNGKCWYILWPFRTYYGFWYILWPFGNLVHAFPYFGILYQDKSGNPV